MMYYPTRPVLLFVGMAALILVPQQMLGADVVSLQDIQWQPLPPTVRGAFVAPDGRVWYRDELRANHRPTVVDLKRMVASAFEQRTPRIDDIEPVLFEPSGRVWFSLCRAGYSMLVGYDGKTWTDYAIADKTNIVSGVCATDGRLNEGLANRFAGGAAWFIMSGGVLRFDGRHWTYQKMQDSTEFPPGSNHWRYHDRIWLAVSPDGKAAIACVSTDNFWIYHEGHWNPRAILGHPHSDASRPTSKEPSGLVLSDTETAWCQTTAGELLQIRIATEAKHKENMGFDFTSFARCRALYDDGLGRTFVVASTSDVVEEDLVIIKDRDGHITKLRGEQFVAGWNIRLNSNKAPILSSHGDRIWLPGKDTDAPKQLDLKVVKLVDVIPHPTYGELHAVSRDGRVFVSAPGSSENPVLVYSPAARATGDVLSSTCIECSSDLFAIDDDGAVWATDPSGRIIHFNGLRWDTVQGGEQHGIRTLIPGHDDVLLACNEKTAALYQGTRQVGAGELAELIEQHLDLVRKAFGPRSGIRHRFQFVNRYGYALAADRDGNIWLVQPPGRLLVYTNGAWHDTNEALVEAGASEGLASTMALVGNGSTVLVDELKLRRCDAGAAFFGGVFGGKLHFAKAPDNCRFGELPRNIASPDGTIWMPSYTRGQHGVSRADETGVRQDLENVGHPLLLDEAGNLWAVELRSRARDQLNVCRNGKIVQHLQIPQLTDAGFLISDRPGSVYARTTLGLQHLVADGPKFEQYRIGKLYALEGIAGDRLGQLLGPYSWYGYSKHGYLVVLGSFATNNKPTHDLYLIKLPATESRP